MVDENKEELTPEEQRRRNRAAGVGGILSMLPSVAGAIPGLRKSGQRGAMRDMQRGRGAGATAARQAASEAGRRVAGNLGGRGSQGLVRAGIRSAEEIAQRGAAEAGRIGAIEGIQGTQMLRDEELRRRALGLQLGTGLGQAAGGALAMLMAARDQGEARRETAPAALDSGAYQLGAGDAARAAGIDEATGLSGAPTAAEGTVARTIQEGEQGLERLRSNQMTPSDLLQQRTTAPTGRFSEPGALSSEVSSAILGQGGVQEPTLDQKVQAQKEMYRQLNMRRSEQPLSSEAGSDDRTQSIYMQRLERALAEGLIHPGVYESAKAQYMETGEVPQFPSESSLPPARSQGRFGR